VLNVVGIGEINVDTNGTVIEIEKRKIKWNFSNQKLNNISAKFLSHLKVVVSYIIANEKKTNDERSDIEGDIKVKIKIENIIV